MKIEIDLTPGQFRALATAAGQIQCDDELGQRSALGDDWRSIGPALKKLENAWYQKLASKKNCKQNRNNSARISSITSESGRPALAASDAVRRTN